VSAGRAAGRGRRLSWWPLALVPATLLLTFFVGAYAHYAVGASATVAAGPTVGTRFGLERAGPIVSFFPTIRSVAPPPHVAVLTFDDGPDPHWTPGVLAVLRRFHVPATFFVVGARVLEHPGLVRTEIADGDEIGSHTFTHVNLGTIPMWRERLELGLTQTALAGAARVHTSLLRLPYSFGPADLRTSQLPAVRVAAQLGYLLVFADHGGIDWERPGVSTIVRDAMPSDGQGEVILLHDGGGDRSQTVAALSELIPLLRAEGYRFATVSQIEGSLARPAMVPVTHSQYVHALLLLWTFRIAAPLFDLVRLLTFLGILLFVAHVLLWSVVAPIHVRKRARPRPGPERWPAVSVIVPAFNEEVSIRATLASLLRSDYPDFEVLVVDDGSVDRTPTIVQGFESDRVHVIQQENRGKAHALIAGVARAAGSIVVTVDADTLFEPDTLRYLVAPFADPTVAAVGGNAKVGNRDGLIGRWQHIEYVMGLNLERRVFDTLQCIPTIPGAVAAFRLEALKAVGGFTSDTLAEDADVTMALNRAGWRSVFEERARAWTEAPDSWKALGQQRFRWKYGALQCMWKHRGAVRSGKGHLRRALAYMLVMDVALPIWLPLIDLFTLAAIVFSRSPAPLVAWLALNTVGLALAVYSFRIDGESLAPLWSFPLQQIVYLRFMSLVALRTLGAALMGGPRRWERQRRTGSLALAARVPGR
jgi:cellulose synthase/poly-beta-1,6-N-acetylglucosamine synthase-like glycosyltransferase/peptidoglycan/xylan/chitin deacetylase (PgdA/CDA1 family)